MNEEQRRPAERGTHAIPTTGRAGLEDGESAEGASRDFSPAAAAEHAAIAAALIGRLLVLRLVPGLIGHISHLLSNLLKVPRPTAIM